MAPNSDNNSEFSFRTRQRHWDALKNNSEQIIDVAIIGGGIVGAGLAHELGLRGAGNVFLFEKNDFASGTSGASSKLIHAGLRYLEQVWVHLKNGRVALAWQNFKFVVEASNERKRLGKMAPVLIRPKQVYFVLSSKDSRSSFSVFLGVCLYALIGLAQGQFFPIPFLSVCRRSIAKKFPELDASKVKSVFGFWDSETDDARLVIENLQRANEAGVSILNYVELVEYKRVDGEIHMRLRNVENGEMADARAKVLINASGPFVDDVRGRDARPLANEKNLVDRVAGSHLNVFPPISANSFYVSASDNRLVFLLCRNEDGLVYTRVGTTERPLGADETSDQPEPTEQELNYLEKLVVEYFPNAQLDGTTIIRADAGIRPLRAQAGLEPFQKSREHEIIDDNGVLHVIGVKLTDFRRVGEEIADKLRIRRQTSRGEQLHARVTPHLYAESSMEDFVNRTMVLHWEDYVFRRRGLRPLMDSRTDPQQARKNFDQLSDLLGWSSKERSREWDNATRKREVPRPGERKAQDPR